MLAELLPEILLIGAALLLVLLQGFCGRDACAKLSGYISLAACGGALLLVSLHSGAGVERVLIPEIIKLDAFSLFFKLLFLTLSFLVILGSLDAVKRYRMGGEYYTMLLFTTFGMLIASMAVDLAVLYIAVELATISTFALAAFRKDRQGAEAGVKYFVIGALSSALVLFGISLLYGIAGSTSLTAIAEALGSSSGPVASLAVVFLIAGFGYKIAAVPFHMWAPDTYQGAPSTVTAFLAGATKKMAFLALMRIFIVALPGLVESWAMLFAVLAVLTMTVGNLVALVQSNIKRMLAYSSVAQAGYVLVAFAVLSSKADLTLAAGAALLHMFVHAIMKGGAFLAVAAAGSAIAGRDISDFAGLGRRMPVTAFTLSIFLLSLAGIPFFAGFVSKFLILMASVSAGGAYIALGVLLVINSVISLYYYAKVIRVMYFEGGEVHRAEEPVMLVAALVVSAIIVLYVGIFPESAIQLAKSSAASLFTP